MEACNDFAEATGAFRRTLIANDEKLKVAQELLRPAHLKDHSGHLLAGADEGHAAGAILYRHKTAQVHNEEYEARARETEGRYAATQAGSMAA